MANCYVVMEIEFEDEALMSEVKPRGVFLTLEAAQERVKQLRADIDFDEKTTIDGERIWTVSPQQYPWFVINETTIELGS